MQLGMGGKIVFDAADEEGLGVGKRFVHDDDHFVVFALCPLDHDVAQKAILGREDAFGEVHLMTITYLDGSLDAGHRVCIMQDWTKIASHLLKRCLERVAGSGGGLRREAGSIQ